MNKSETPNYIDVPLKGFFFVPLGGVGEIGMNFGLYACDGRWIAVDCGIGFAGDRLPGVNMILPDPSFAQSIADDLIAIVITHAHEDHIGAVGHFWQKLRCPVYVTPFASEMLETRLDEAGILGRVPVEVINIGDVIDLDPFEVEFVGVNHSIPEATSLLIRTKYGAIFHTGDWRFDETPVIGEPPNHKALKELKKENILAVVGDSTNVFVEDDIASESEVQDSFIELFSKYTGRRIIITCFASNVGRIESIALAAQKNGRSVCLLGRSLWRVEGAGRASGYFKNINVFLTEEESQELPHDQIVYLCTGCQGEPKAALSNLSYGLYRSLVMKKGDVVIFSSRVIPGNEQAIGNIQNRFIAKGVELVTDKDALVHVSGHSGRQDIAKMYQYLQPQIAIPVHGEIAHLYEHAKLALECGVPQVVQIKDGDVLRLAPDVCEVIGEVKTGILAIDGKQIISVNADVLRKRRRMIDEGTVVATVVLNKKNQVVGEVQFSAVGLIDSDSPQMRELSILVKKSLNDLKKEHLKQDKTIIDTVKATVRKMVMQTHGRRPMVETHLVRL